MKIILIAAIGKNNELGYDNHLLWHIKEDMKFFKETTINHSVLMGYNTYLSLPGLLKHRNNMVMSRSHSNLGEGVTVFKSFDDFFNTYKNVDEDVFIIGGASLYKFFIDKAEEMYLTQIEDSKEADAFFPQFNKDDYNNEIIKTGEENNIKYSFHHYVKKLVK